MAPKNQKFDGLLLYKTLNLMKTSSFIYFLYSPLTPIHLLEYNDPILRGSHSLILLNMWLMSFLILKFEQILVLSVVLTFVLYFSQNLSITLF